MRGPGSAHHAFSPVYDSKRSVTVSGVVTEFRFANPHAMLSLDVKDDAGKPAKWTVEFAGQLNLSEIGWTKESLKPGEQITVTGNPTHVVSHQMAFVRIVKADGTVLVPAAAQRTDILGRGAARTGTPPDAVAVKTRATAWRTSLAVAPYPPMPANNRSRVARCGRRWSCGSRHRLVARHRDGHGPSRLRQVADGRQHAGSARAEERHDLRNGRQDDRARALVWRYELGDSSRDAVAAIVRDPAVADTNYIDRSTYEVDDSTLTVATRIPSILRPLPFPFSTDNRFESLWFLFHVQSLCLIAAGACCCGARALRRAATATLAIAVLLGVGVAAYAFPYARPFRAWPIRAMYTKNRSNFETALRTINFENHLTLALLAKHYPAFGPGEDAPERTFSALTRRRHRLVRRLCAGDRHRRAMVAARGPVPRACAAGPSTLMYFGHRDFAYLSLNLAAFPLLAHGISEGSKRLEAGSALAGLGAALHAFGLLSLVGAWIGALVARAPIVAARRTRPAHRRVGNRGVGGMACDLHRSCSTCRSHGPCRFRVMAAALHRPTRKAPERRALHPAGIRDLLMSAWVVGVPLLVVAALALEAASRSGVVRRSCYAMPSVPFWIFYGPRKASAVDTGHVFGAFPAFFAGAWLCARERRHTAVAAAAADSGASCLLAGGARHTIRELALLPT